MLIFFLFKGADRAVTVQELILSRYFQQLVAELRHAVELFLRISKFRTEEEFPGTALASCFHTTLSGHTTSP